MDNVAEVAKFIIVGITTNILNFVLFLFFRHVDAGIFVASIAAYAIAIVYSFSLSNFYVFSQSSKAIHSSKLVSYVAVILISAVLQASTTTAAFEISEMQNASWALGAVVAAIFNYLSLKKYVFVD